MRPFRDHYVSTCLCLFNATANEPQHCEHYNLTNIYNVYDWVFGNKSVEVAMQDPMITTAEELVACGSPCVSHCVAECGAYFVEHVPPETNNGSIYLHRYNATYRRTGYPLSLTDWNISNVITPGHWRSAPSCFDPCMRTCAVTNCTGECADECDGNWLAEEGYREGPAPRRAPRPQPRVRRFVHR